MTGEVARVDRCGDFRRNKMTFGDYFREERSLDVSRLRIHPANLTVDIKPADRTNRRVCGELRRSNAVDRSWVQRRIRTFAKVVDPAEILPAHLAAENQSA